MRFTHGLTLVAATVIGPLVVADAAAQVTRIDFQVVESPAFDGESFRKHWAVRAPPGSGLR